MSIDTDSIREWYEANGMEYLDGDWGERAENGESASSQTQEPERVGRERVTAIEPHAFAALEEARGVLEPMVRPRNDHDTAVLEAVDDFFETHLPAVRPAQKQQALEDLMLSRASVNELAADKGVSKQAVSQARKRALSWVVREVADQWPDPEGSDEQRAWAVFATFWRDRFGADFPNTEVGQTA